MACFNEDPDLCPEGVVAVALPETGDEHDEDDSSLEEGQYHQQYIPLTKSHNYYNTVQPLIKDLLRKGQPPNKGHTSGSLSHRFNFQEKETSQ